MAPEMEFFIYLLENYADYKETDADSVLKRWDELGLTELIYDMYPRYHSERIENAFDDIDALIAERVAGASEGGREETGEPLPA